MKNWFAMVFVHLALLGPVAAQQVLKVAVNESSKQYQSALIALYKEVGLKPEFVVLPWERALRSVESGEVDADLGRVAGGTAGYQNMLELNEPLSEISLIAVVKKNSSLAKLSVPELKGRSVGVVRGTKMAEGAMAKLNQEPTMVNTPQQMYQMLLADRFEIALTTSTTMPGPDVAASVRTLPPLMTSKAIHVLNKKWSPLAPKLDAALKAMKADGRWATLIVTP